MTGKQLARQWMFFLLLAFVALALQLMWRSEISDYRIIAWVALVIHATLMTSWAFKTLVFGEDAENEKGKAGSMVSWLLALVLAVLVLWGLIRMSSQVTQGTLPVSQGQDPAVIREEMPAAHQATALSGQGEDQP